MVNLDTLAKEYYPKIIRRVRYLVPTEDVEDATQDIFLAMVTSIDSYRELSVFETWLYSLARNKIADYYRKGLRSIPKDRDVFDDDLVTEQSHSNLIMRDIIQQLPENYKGVIWDAFVLGMTFTEIADRELLSYEAARSRYRRALKWMESHNLVEEN